VGVSGGASVGVSEGTTVGEADGLAAVGVGEATAVVGVAVLSADDLARGSWALPCPGRGRTVGGLEGALVAVAVDSGGATVGVSGGASAGVSEGTTVGEATTVVGVAVLSTANSARGSLVWPCPGRG
jgi:hypothetical protein